MLSSPAVKEETVPLPPLDCLDLPVLVEIFMVPAVRINFVFGGMQILRLIFSHILLLFYHCLLERLFLPVILSFCMESYDGIDKCF